MNIFREAGILRENNERNLSTEKYLELVENFPNSVYAGLALQWAIENHKFQYTPEDKEITRNLSKQLVENYPESDYALPTLQWIMDDYQMREDIEGAKQYIEDLEGKTENSVIINALQKYSEEIE